MAYKKTYKWHSIVKSDNVDMLMAGKISKYLLQLFIFCISISHWHLIGWDMTVKLPEIIPVFMVSQ